jgi:hypothetical protein
MPWLWMRAASGGEIRVRNAGTYKTKHKSSTKKLGYGQTLTVYCDITAMRRDNITTVSNAYRL